MGWIDYNVSNCGTTSSCNLVISLATTHDLYLTTQMKQNRSNIFGIRLADYSNTNKVAHTSITDIFSKKANTDLQYKYIASDVCDMATDKGVV